MEASLQADLAASNQTCLPPDGIMHDGKHIGHMIEFSQIKIFFVKIYIFCQNLYFFVKIYIFCQNLDFWVKI